LGKRRRPRNPFVTYSCTQRLARTAAGPSATTPAMRTRWSRRRRKRVTTWSPAGLELTPSLLNATCRWARNGLPLQHARRAAGRPPSPRPHAYTARSYVRRAGQDQDASDGLKGGGRTHLLRSGRSTTDGARLLPGGGVETPWTCALGGPTVITHASGREAVEGGGRGTANRVTTLVPAWAARHAPGASAGFTRMTGRCDAQQRAVSGPRRSARRRHEGWRTSRHAPDPRDGMKVPDVRDSRANVSAACQKSRGVRRSAGAPRCPAFSIGARTAARRKPVLTTRVPCERCVAGRRRDRPTGGVRQDSPDRLNAVAEGHHARSPEGREPAPARNNEPGNGARRHQIWVIRRDRCVPSPTRAV
jgi:hypothetical protein